MKKVFYCSFSLVAFLLFFNQDSNAQVPVLMKDINPGPVLSGMSEPRNLRIFNEQLYFTAYNDTGAFLFRSDGTGDNTIPVTPLVYASEFIEMNGRLYFRSRGHTNDDMELWTSDGTDAGTFEVKDISADIESNPYMLTVFNDKIYFQAGDLVHGREVWMSDGTEAGTELLKDIYPTTPGYQNNPQGFSVFNNNLYFTANDSIHGDELWVTDGTSAGTHLFKDINPGPGGSMSGGYNGEFKRFNNKLFFSADDGTHGWELWVTDGTESGTVLLKDIAAGADTSYPSGFIEFQSRLFFSGNNGKDIWATDGTEAGTVQVKAIYSGTGNPYPGAGGFTEWNGKLYFSADDGATGGELWVTDGTGQGTVLISDINAGPDGSSPGGFKIFENKLYFFASGATYGYQLYLSDGTAANTQMIAPFNPLPNAIYYSNTPLEFNGTLFYTALYDSIIGREVFYLGPGTIGFDKLSAGNASVYPNPSNGTFTVQSDDQINQISLFDLAGNMVMNETGINSNLKRLDCNTFSSGIYMLRIITDKGTITRKLIMTD